MGSCVVILKYDIEGSFRARDEEISPSLEKKPSKSIKWNSFRNFVPLLSACIGNIVRHIVTGSCYCESFSFAITLMFSCYTVKRAAEKDNGIAVRLSFLQPCKKGTSISISDEFPRIMLLMWAAITTL
jgi:hypothetical protein